MNVAGNLEFVSVVGTQAMGTLQPWLAAFQQFGAMPACLLYTGRTAEVARRLSEYARQNGMGEAELIAVSKSLAGEDSAPAVIGRLAAKAAENGSRLLFNVEGGLNFLIAACALALKDTDAIFIQASRNRIVISDPLGNEAEEWGMPPMLPLATILELQGVQYTASDPPENRLLARCKDLQIKLPSNHIRNITIAECPLTWPGIRAITLSASSKPGAKETLPKKGNSPTGPQTASYVATCLTKGFTLSPLHP